MNLTIENGSYEGVVYTRFLTSTLFQNGRSEFPKWLLLYTGSHCQLLPTKQNLDISSYDRSGYIFTLIIFDITVSFKFKPAFQNHRTHGPETYVGRLWLTEFIKLGYSLNVHA